MDIAEIRKLTRDMLADIIIDTTTPKDAFRTEWGVVSRTAHDIRIVSDQHDRWRWSERLGESWPASVLASVNERVTIILDHRGNLVDMFDDRDDDVAWDIPGDEFDAYVEDVLMRAVEIHAENEEVLP